VAKKNAEALKLDDPEPNDKTTAIDEKYQRDRAM
jgi:hypothetical protein